MDLWCIKHGIIRHGYSGGGYDGVNANKILLQIDDLAKTVPLQLVPVVNTLQCFAKVYTRVIK